MPSAVNCSVRKTYFCAIFCKSRHYERWSGVGHAVVHLARHVVGAYREVSIDARYREYRREACLERAERRCRRHITVLAAPKKKQRNKKTNKPTNFVDHPIDKKCRARQGRVRCFLPLALPGEPEPGRWSSGEACRLSPNDTCR